MNIKSEEVIWQLKINISVLRTRIFIRIAAVNYQCKRVTSFVLKIVQIQVNASNIVASGVKRGM